MLPATKSVLSGQLDPASLTPRERAIVLLEVVASTDERPGIVSQLAMAGDPHLTTEYGCTALHLAVLRDHPKTLAALLDAGYPLEPDAQGRSPLYLSVLFGSPAAEAVLRRYEAEDLSAVTLLRGSLEIVPTIQLAPDRLAEILYACLDRMRTAVFDAKLPFEHKKWGTKEALVLRKIFGAAEPLLTALDDLGVDWNATRPTARSKTHPLYVAVQTHIVELVAALLRFGSAPEIARKRNPRAWRDILDFEPNRLTLARGQLLAEQEP